MKFFAYLFTVNITSRAVYTFCTYHFLLSLLFILDCFSISGVAIFVILSVIYILISLYAVYIFEKYFLSKFLLDRITLRSALIWTAVLNFIVTVFNFLSLFGEGKFAAILAFVEMLAIFIVYMRLYYTDFDALCPPWKRCYKHSIKVIIFIISFFVGSLYLKLYDYLEDYTGILELYRMIQGI